MERSLYSQHAFLKSEILPAAYRVLWLRHALVLFQVQKIVDVSGDDGHLLTFILEAGSGSETVGIPLNEIGVVAAILEIRHINDSSQIADVGRQPHYLIFVQCPSHPLYGIFAFRRPYNQLAYHGVIIHRDFIALINVGVNTGTDAMGLQNLSDHAWRGHEVVLCVLCAYTAFYGMAMLADVFLMELKRLTIGYENLLFHQIHSHHFFGDGMLHLKTGVHFQKIKLMVFVNKELNRASTLISNSFGCGYG